MSLKQNNNKKKIYAEWKKEDENKQTTADQIIIKAIQQGKRAQQNPAAVPTERTSTSGINGPLDKVLPGNDNNGRHPKCNAHIVCP